MIIASLHRSQIIYYALIPQLCQCPSVRIRSLLAYTENPVQLQMSIKCIKVLSFESTHARVRLCLFPRKVLFFIFRGGGEGSCLSFVKLPARRIIGLIIPYPL